MHSTLHLKTRQYGILMFKKVMPYILLFELRYYKDVK